MSTRSLLARFEAWRAEGRPLVLATVTETAGSTYSKAGHRILLRAAGDYEGLVSGGCLEGDLLTHARRVLDAGAASVVSYDLRDEADELFGLGIGCNGLLRILLQPLLPAAGYEPFAAMAAVLGGDTPGRAATIVAGPAGGPAPGSSLVVADGRQVATGLGPADRDTLLDLLTGLRTSALVAVNLPAGACQVLATPLVPVPRLLILGANRDAVPLVNLAAQLGWRVSIADHRPGNLDRGDLGAAEDVMLLTPGELARRVALGHFAAAVVMSHHLETDRQYLAVLAASSIPYVGLLGPVARRDRLLRDLGTAAEGLTGRLHGPAGVALGAHTPEAIALAILAQLEAMVRTPGPGPGGSRP